MTCSGCITTNYYQNKSSSKLEAEKIIFMIYEHR